MGARENAAALKEWAINSGFIDQNRRDPLGAVNAAQNLVDLAAFEEQSSVFRRREISIIAFNEAESKILVFLHKALTKKEKKDLPQYWGTSEIIYTLGGSGYAGTIPPKPYAQGPYDLHNGKYTCGSSIGLGNVVTAGTLGCLVTKADGSLFGLTNNHVIGNCNFTQPDFPIVAPGLVDVQVGHTDPFTIGHHFAVGPMQDGLPDVVDISLNQDSAIFKLKDINQISSMQRGFYDTPSIITDIIPGMIVEKVGRTTVHSVGIVQGQVSGPELINYTVAGLGRKVVFYNDLFIVKSTALDKKFSDSGDSGSLVVTTINGVRHAVGIVVGGNEPHGISYVLPISPVLESLQVSIVSDVNV